MCESGCSRLRLQVDNFFAKILLGSVGYTVSEWKNGKLQDSVQTVWEVHLRDGCVIHPWSGWEKMERYMFVLHAYAGATPWLGRSTNFELRYLEISQPHVEKNKHLLNVNLEFFDKFLIFKVEGELDFVHPIWPRWEGSSAMCCHSVGTRINTVFSVKY